MANEVKQSLYEPSFRAKEEIATVFDLAMTFHAVFSLQPIGVLAMTGTLLI